MKYLAGIWLLFCTYCSDAQHYTTANAHSHNDYVQRFPLEAAWKAGFGSVEADIFLVNGELLVAHDSAGLPGARTLEEWYLRPIDKYIRTNKGFIYSDTARRLLLLIDIKTEAVPTLNRLVSVLERYPAIIRANSITIAISGNRPDPSSYSSWPSWLMFDGEFSKDYSPAELKKIALVSGNFKNYSSWNGKGRLPEKEKQAVAAQVHKAHEWQKPARFWNAPDILNSWYAYMALGIDYINTDHIEAMADFFAKLPDRSFTNPSPHAIYTPKYRNDGQDRMAKNVILIIGDGTALPQWYAGYTANRGAMNVFSMRHTGQSKTSSYDNYITDSAPGATAFSSGKKTNNRAVGVDHTGLPVAVLPDILVERDMITGVVTTGDFRDATPASFYAHRSERSDYNGMMEDLLANTPALIAGSCPGLPASAYATSLQAKADVFFSVDKIPASSVKPVIVADSIAALPAMRGRSDWGIKAFDKAIRLLSAHRPGFFLVYEGAQVDHGGHANKLPWLVTEVLDLDKVIGRAMQFADSNGETLVIVTADHETGGLTLTGGDFSKGYVTGQFSTEDHTAIPVPVFAYGPGAHLFDGVYENAEIFRKILSAVKIPNDHK